jgi:uncharacterized protein (TIGR02246 family)
LSTAAVTATTIKLATRLVKSHQQILDTIYAGSTVRYQVLQARELADRVIVAHARGTLNAPSGPLAGEHASTITVVLLKQTDKYEITAFHNTLITDRAANDD